MIKYTLKCAQGHVFEAWFRGSSAFDTLLKAGQVSCAACGTIEVEKTLMAPSVTPARKKASPDAARRSEVTTREVTTPQITTPVGSPMEQAMRALREHLHRHSDYVGKEFATEARKIHDGDADERSIWGEATSEDAKALLEDGIAVAPLPPMVRRDD